MLLKCWVTKKERKEKHCNRWKHFKKKSDAVNQCHLPPLFFPIMSLLESALHNIISQATQDYKDIATNDPVVQSSDDNTARGDHLDRILRAQQLEKKALWDKLYQVATAHG